MQYLLLIFLIIFLFIIFNLDVYENLSEGKVPPSNIKPSSPKLPIKPDLSSNKPLGQYSNENINNPERVNKERQDVKENKSYSIQPKDMYFDIFDVNCTQPFKRPWSCLLIKGNNVNNLPIENCQKVCPENFVKKGDKYVPKIEQFKDFVSENPYPSHYYCIAPCKKVGCIKKKYNVLDPSKNTCGQNGFSQVPLNVYYSEEDCLEDNFPCNDLPKDKCLLKTQCGWCTNNSGQGICVRGTTSGSLDPKIPCVPDREKGTSAYFKGNADPFKGVQQDWKN